MMQYANETKYDKHLKLLTRKRREEFRNTAGVREVQSDDQVNGSNNSLNICRRVTFLKVRAVPRMSSLLSFSPLSRSCPSLLQSS